MTVCVQTVPFIMLPSCDHETMANKKVTRRVNEMFAVFSHCCYIFFFEEMKEWLNKPTDPPTH